MATDDWLSWAPCDTKGCAADGPLPCIPYDVRRRVAVPHQRLPWEPRLPVVSGPRALVVALLQPIAAALMLPISAVVGAGVALGLWCLRLRYLSQTSLYPWYTLGLNARFGVAISSSLALRPWKEKGGEQCSIEHVAESAVHIICQGAIAGSQRDMPCCAGVGIVAGGISAISLSFSMLHASSAASAL